MGKPIASKKLPCRSIRSVCSTGSNASTVAPAMATSGPGMIRTLAGSFDHINRIAITVPPTITSCSS
ncbi:Uncharacterised protein [Mycobacterium tuberculosis]|nr:Uncharacterised protein [Mycobacterium tuberculosis]COX20662.1 Uncharacterised protein [Mycobacterium tuberculosis]